MMSGEAAPARLAFDGSLTIRTAALSHARLVEAVRGRDVIIDCDAASEVDLSFIQLILAARRSAVRNGCRLTLSRRPSGALLDALQSGGFVPSDPSVPSHWPDEAAG